MKSLYKNVLNFSIYRIIGNNTYLLDNLFDDSNLTKIFQELDFVELASFVNLASVNLDIVSWKLLPDIVKYRSEFIPLKDFDTISNTNKKNAFEFFADFTHCIKFDTVGFHNLIEHIDSLCSQYGKIPIYDLISVDFLNTISQNKEEIYEKQKILLSRPKLLNVIFYSYINSECEENFKYIKNYNIMSYLKYDHVDLEEILRFFDEISGVVKNINDPDKILKLFIDMSDYVLEEYFLYRYENADDKSDAILAYFTQWVVNTFLTDNPASDFADKDLVMHRFFLSQYHKYCNTKYYYYIEEFSNDLIKIVNDCPDTEYHILPDDTPYSLVDKFKDFPLISKQLQEKIKIFFNNYNNEIVEIKINELFQQSYKFDRNGTIDQENDICLVFVSNRGKSASYGNETWGKSHLEKGFKGAKDNPTLNPIFCLGNAVHELNDPDLSFLGSIKNKSTVIYIAAHGQKNAINDLEKNVIKNIGKIESQDITIIISGCYAGKYHSHDLWSNKNSSQKIKLYTTSDDETSSVSGYYGDYLEYLFSNLSKKDMHDTIIDHIRKYGEYNIRHTVFVENDGIDDYAIGLVGGIFDDVIDAIDDII